MTTLTAGPHVDRSWARGARPMLSKHVEAALAHSAERGFEAKAFAVFVAGPRVRKVTLTAAERPPLRQLIGRDGLTGFAHSAYCAFPFGGDPSAAEFVHEESAAAEEAGLSGLVVHLPAKPLEEARRFFGRIVDGAGVPVYFETPAAVKENAYYSTPEALGRLWSALPDGCGICVDTAHVWTSGEDLSEWAAAAEWLDRLALEVPARRLLLHLNDSGRPLGCGPDVHAPLLEGKIWGRFRGAPESSGLAAVVEWAAREGVPAILERKQADLDGDYRVLSGLRPGGTN